MTAGKELLARVEEPEWERLPAETPPTLIQALRVCLTKDSKLRVHHMADVRLAIAGAFETTKEISSQPTGWRLSWAIAAALAFAAVRRRIETTASAHATRE